MKWTYRDTKVDGGPPGRVIRVERIGGAGSGNVDDGCDLMLFQHFPELALVFHGHKNFLDVQVGFGVDVFFHFRGYQSALAFVVSASV